MNIYTIAEDLTEEIGKLTPEQKKARKEKVKAGGKKFAFGLTFAALLPIRAAFNAVVAMNLNALATNLKFVYDNRTKTTTAEWKKIEAVWKKVGGLQNALLKAIRIGARKKPFFLSKKAKKKFEAKAKQRAGISVIAEATIVTLAASAAGLIAAVLPPVLIALKKGGQNQAAQQVEQQAAQQVQEFQESPKNFETNVEEATETEGIFQQPGGGPYASLFTALGQVANVGIQAAGNAITKKAKKNKKAQKFLETANTATEDYATGRYLRQTGLTQTAQQFGQSAGKIGKYILPIAAVAGAYLIFRKK
jgi:type II secretory pathway pseudopilin PulG